MCEAVIGDRESLISGPHVLPAEPANLRSLMNPGAPAFVFVEPRAEIEGRGRPVTPQDVDQTHIGSHAVIPALHHRYFVLRRLRWLRHWSSPLRTLKDSPCPQAVATDGEGIAEAVRFILLAPVAAAAIDAGRKIKSPDAVAKSDIVLLHPDGLQ